MLKDADSERSTARLQAFRRAAERAHDVLDRFPDQRFITRFAIPGKPDELTGLPVDTFVRLLADVRLVYLPGQEAHFNLVYNIVRARLEPSLHSQLSVVKANWKASMGRGSVFQSVSSGATTTLTVRQAIEVLMHGELFHQDPELQDGAELLRKLGSLSTVVLQNSLWHLAQTVVQLDGFVAYLLNEPPLKRGPNIAEWARRHEP